MTEHWIEIIPPMKRADGEKKFKIWKENNEAIFKKLKADQIKINYIYGKNNGDLIQYFIIADYEL